jgi:hypothetical protein
MINIIINNINLASTRFSEFGATEPPLNILTEANLDIFGVRKRGEGGRDGNRHTYCV